MSCVQILTNNLWQHLGEATPERHPRSVDLLFQLHQMVPSHWLCEDVIGNNLLSDNKVSVFEFEWEAGFP